MGKKGRKGFVIKPKQYNPTGMFYIVNDKKDTLLIMEFAELGEEREEDREKSTSGERYHFHRPVNGLSTKTKQKKKHKKEQNAARHTMESIVKRKQALEKYSRSVCCYKHTHIHTNKLTQNLTTTN